jgi:auxin efflux carrier family protein
MVRCTAPWGLGCKPTLTNVDGLAAMNPPLVATLLAFVVGLVPPFKALFFGTGAPLSLTVTAVLEGFGQCAIPSTLLVMGAQVLD